MTTQATTRRDGSEVSVARSRMLVTTVALAYVGTLWMTAVNHAVGEHTEPVLPTALHVLQQGSLLLPVVLVVVGAAMLLRGWAGVVLSATGSALVLAAVPLVRTLLGGEAGQGPAVLGERLAVDALVALAACLPTAAAVHLLRRGRRGGTTISAATDHHRSGSWSPARRRRAVVAAVAACSVVMAGSGQVALATTASEPAQAPPACKNNGREIVANVVALDEHIVYNRLGAHDPHGMIFALRRDVVSKSTGKPEAAGSPLEAGKVRLRSDKRPRPLTLRMNVGDCLTVNFQNLLSPTPKGNGEHAQPATRAAGMSVIGLQLKNTILSDGTNVGRNEGAPGSKGMAGLVQPGDRATYTWYAEREGAYQLYSPGDTVSTEGIGTLAHGLFGAVNVEPKGAEWYRSQVTRDDMDLATARDGAGQPRYTPPGHPIIDYDAVYPVGHPQAGTPILNMLDANNEIVHSDLTAVITGPGRGNFAKLNPDGSVMLDGTGQPVDWYPPNKTYPNRNEPFREITVIFHDEAAVVQAFEDRFEDPEMKFTLSGVRDGKAINYGTGGIAAEVLSNRLGVGPAADCVDCKLEEFFLTSWALGDPAQVTDLPADESRHLDPTGKGRIAQKVHYPDDPSNVTHSYLNDHVKFRNVHVGKEHHIFHLHSHQWLQTPDDDNSSYLDSQAIGPGSTYTYEIAYGGSGNRNKTPGDAIYHCHFYPHFAQGMWALWRNHDVFQRGTDLTADGKPKTGASGGLPDGEIKAGTPTPAVVPLPGLAMAPMPGVDAAIVDGQVDLDHDSIADHTEGWPAPAANPGFPYYIPGVAGHRPPTPPLDMTDPREPSKVMHGGLSRHVITGGEVDAARTHLTPYDYSKVVDTATAAFPDEQGTPAEKMAMEFHEQLRHSTYRQPTNASSAPEELSSADGRGFETNGLKRTPGAPFAEPCRNDDGTLTASALKPRVYKGVDIQLDMKLNKLGWHFPQARMLSLWQDAGPTLSGKRAPEPFVMRANSGDCIDYYHTNLIPGNYEQDAYQVRTPTDIIGQHIHLVKFDVTASDGSGNGYNYEDGTLAPEEVQERIAALRKQNGCGSAEGASGSQTCPVAQAHPYFGAGPHGDWLGARTTIQRWWADPVLNNRGVDRTLGNVYTHDHYGPSTHQQTGLYATLIIEPAKSAWRDPESGKCFGDTSLAGRPIPTDWKSGGCTPVTGRTDGGPTSWRADVLTYDGAKSYNHEKESYREFYFEFSDFQHAYAAGKGATWEEAVVKIGGASHTIKVAKQIHADPLNAVNPAGNIENEHVGDTSPWLKVKPTLEGQPDKCPTSRVATFTERGCPESISTDDVGTFSMNYRNEPVPARLLDPATMRQAAGAAGDPSLAFSSTVKRADPRLNVQPTDPYPPLTADVKPGDPYTPMMRAYEGDNVQIKVQVGATEEGHNAGLWGSKWLQEFASPDSGWRNSQMMGISEQFNWDVVTAVDPAQKGRGADYLFSPDNSVDGMWNGMWSLLRGYSKFRVKTNALGTDLLPLPSNRIDQEPNGINAVAPESLAQFDSKTKYQCPTSAPKRTFMVTAVLARDVLPQGTLAYNSRAGGLHDPTAIMYVRSSDLGADGRLKPGVPVEPLILRAAAGECINLQLTNKLPASMPDLNGNNMMPPIIDRFTANAPATAARDSFNANDLRPSNRVGLRPQLVAYDTTRGAGNSLGVNGDNTVAPGATRAYWWYAGDLRYDLKSNTMTATPMEFGAVNLVSSDPLKHSNKGAVGALVIEPQGSTWTEDAGSRAQATVQYSEGGVHKSFRDFVLVFQDDINMRNGDGSPVPFVTGEDDAEDTGMKALNYRTEPLWHRLDIGAAASPAEIAATDFTRSLANSQVGGDPETPVLTAKPNQDIRLRVLQPGGHARNHVFALHGHVWERNPYTKGSTVIGPNAQSQWVGSQEGHGPTDHFDVVPKHGAGGAYGVQGDYLYRDMSPFSFYNGLWGLLRVE